MGRKRTATRKTPQKKAAEEAAEETTTTTTETTPEETKQEEKEKETEEATPDVDFFTHTVIILDKDSLTDKKLLEDLTEKITTLGGKAVIPRTPSVMTRTINATATHFVVKDATKPADKYPHALRNNKRVKVMVAQWILDSFAQKKNVEKPEFELKPFDAEKEEEEKEEEETKAEQDEDAKEAKASKPAKKRGRAAKAAAAADEDEKEVDDGTKDGDEEKKTKIVVKGKAAVDSLCPVADATHVIESGGVVYDCMLNQTNIAGNNNKFYVIQALQEDKSGKCYCWTRWGRVGENGQNRLMPCTNAAMACKQFEQKFREKTRNNFVSVKKGEVEFKTVPGLYTMIEIDYGNSDDEKEKDEAAAKKKEEAKEPKEEPKSKLDPRVQDLVRLIFDMKMMEQVMKELEFDCKKQPLGKLTKDQIKRGYQVLTEIEKEIKEMKKSRVSRDKLMELTNQFYTLIPHNFGRNRPPLIDSEEMLKKKMNMLEALADIEIAAHLVEGTKDEEEINQLDANYACLNADIQPVERDSEDYKLIEKYVRNTHPRATPKVANIFRLRRECDEKRFEEKKGLGNRMLLWHGSRLTNYVGILSQGLRIAPPEAPCSGYRFGKGIYFADMAQLSANYCRAWGQKYFLMLLGDVALGKTADLSHDQFMTKPLPGSDSTKALGTVEPDPKENVVREDGVVVPCGKVVDSGNKGVSCYEHQYIIYDVAQCRLQYLIQFEQ